MIKGNKKSLIKTNNKMFDYKNTFMSESQSINNLTAEEEIS